MRIPFRSRRFIFGAILGTAVVPAFLFTALNWLLPPAWILVLWPTVLFSIVEPESWLSISLVVIASWTGNAILYGTVATLPRRAIALIVALQLGVVWWLTPPDDAHFEAYFQKHRSPFEELMQMAEADSSLILITPTRVTIRETTVDNERKSFSTSDVQSALPEARWNRYRELFQKTGSIEISRDPQSGEVLIAIYEVDPAHRVRHLFSEDGKLHFTAADHLAIYIAYAYCPPSDDGYGCRTGHGYKNLRTAQTDPFVRIEGGWSLLRMYARNGPVN